MKLAARAGLSIEEPLTPGEMMVYAMERNYSIWDHTSMVISSMCNVFGGKTKPKQFHPQFQKRENRPLTFKDFVIGFGGTPNAGTR